MTTLAHSATVHSLRSGVPPCNPDGVSPSMRTALPRITGPVFTVRRMHGAVGSPIGVPVDASPRPVHLRVEWTGPLSGPVEDAPGRSTSPSLGVAP
jgi:hypothetical protein